MKKSILFMIAILICVSILTACGGKTEEGEEAKLPYQEGAAGVLSLPLTHFDTFNPVLTQSDTVLEAMSLVYDGLYRRQGDDSMKAVLASTTDISSDGLTYTVQLKKGVRWHDDKEFTAHDVVYTLSAIETAEASKLKGCLYGVESYTATSNSVVEFKLTEPNSCFLEQLDFPIVQKGTDCSQVQADYKPIGTSAYCYVPSTLIRTHVLEKNPNCVTVPLGEIIEVVLKEIPSADNVMYALESREIEAVHVDTEHLLTYSPKGNVTTIAYTNRNFTFLGVGNQGALADKQVRRAISALIDREAIKTNAMFGRFVASDLPFVPGGIYNPTGTAQNKEDAAEILTAAGYEKNSDGRWQKETEEGTQTVTVSVLVNEDNDVRCATAEEIVKQLNAFGIGAYVEKTDFETYTLRAEAYEYSLLLGETVLADSLDVSVFVGSGARFTAPGGQNMDTLLYNAKQATSQTAKNTAFSALAEALSDEMPLISLGFGQNAVIVNDRIVGEIAPVYGNVFGDFSVWNAK